MASTYAVAALTGVIWVGDSPYVSALKSKRDNRIVSWDPTITSGDDKLKDILVQCVRSSEERQADLARPQRTHADRTYSLMHGAM